MLNPAGHRGRDSVPRLGLASKHTYSEMAHAWRVTFKGCGVRTGSAGRRGVRAEM